MSTSSLYGWLVLAAFALFVICLGWVSETTEENLSAQNNKGRRP